MNEFWIHNLDPVALEFGMFQLRWYGIAYAVGFIFAWRYGMILAAKGHSALIPKQIDQFLLYALFGVMIGGRLGQVLFYYPEYYFANPQEILQVWKGGMSFHGGFLGVIIAATLFCKRHRLSFFSLSDNLAITAPFGIMLGRIANFINGEHAGRISDVVHAVIFPAISPDPRHPSQLYEALLEGLIPFMILYWLAKRGALKRAGLLSGLFLMLYAIGRSISELFRDPEILIASLPSFLTYGMLLSLPMLLVGLFVVHKVLQRPISA